MELINYVMSDVMSSKETMHFSLVTFLISSSSPNTGDTGKLYKFTVLLSVYFLILVVLSFFAVASRE